MSQKNKNISILSDCLLLKNINYARVQMNAFHFNPLSANPTKWSNTLKQFVGNLPTNCLSVFDHFVELALKGLTQNVQIVEYNTANIILFAVNQVANVLSC